MAGEEKAEVDGAVKRREVVLDTDWLTATVAVLGIVFLLLAISIQGWHLVRGGFSQDVGSHGTLDHLSLAFAAGVSVWFAIKLRDRTLRFGFGLMAVPMCVQLIAGVLGHPLVPASILFAMFLANLAGLLLFLFFAITWLRKKAKAQ